MSQLNIPPERKDKAITEKEVPKKTATAPKEHMTSSLIMKELEAAIHTLCSH
jgi:hypothetical protein